jgi:ABC-2 type transport system permease protein
MNWSRVRAVLARELLEIRKSRMLIFTIVLPPLLLTLLPIGLTLAIGGNALERSNITPEDIRRYIQLAPELAGLPGGVVMQVIILRQFLTMYLILPLIIPTTIATASIIGEKEMRSLEPLLATPVRTGELLLAKCLAAIIPAILATWLAYALFLVSVRVTSSSDAVFGALFSPTWFLAMLLFAPLLCLLAVSLAVIISSRVNDTRVAQQLAGVVVIPIVALAVGQTAGVVVLNLVIFSIASLLVFLIDAAVLYAGVQLFERETILTRWK